MNNDKTQFKKNFVKRLIRFSLTIIKLADTLPNNKANTIVSQQIIRSSTSIGANIVEAKGCSSRKDYTNFFSHALKSANETLYWLILMEGIDSRNKPRCQKLIEETKEICKIIASSILTLKNRK